MIKIEYYLNFNYFLLRLSIFSTVRFYVYIELLVILKGYLLIIIVKKFFFKDIFYI